MKLLLIPLALALSGCSQFSNRVYCSPAGDEAAFISWYMKLGVAAQVDPKDAVRLCQKELSK